MSAALRPCVQCGELYQPTAQRVKHPQRFCSTRCASDYASAKTRASYPPREEIERLWCEEGMSDRAIGKRYGHSYQWSLSVRQHYGLTVAVKAKKLPKRVMAHHGYVTIGRDYEHRRVMAERLGRELLPGEVVHHIDGNRANNDPSNLSLFKNNGDHTSHEAKLKGKKTRRAWKGPREKVAAEGACRVCGRSDVRLEAAHIIARAWTRVGADEGEHPDNIVPLCAERCHPAYDQKRDLDLLPYLTLPEQARAVQLHPDGLVGAYRRLTNSRTVA